MEQLSFFILKTSLFMYIVLFKSDDIYSKNMICKKLYRKMFNKHEIRD